MCLCKSGTIYVTYSWFTDVEAELKRIEVRIHDLRKAAYNSSRLTLGGGMIVWIIFETLL